MTIKHRVAFPGPSNDYIMTGLFLSHVSGREKLLFCLTRQGRLDTKKLQARSSGGERYPDTVEVTSSNLVVPTSQIKG